MPLILNALKSGRMLVMHSPRRLVTGPNEPTAYLAPHEDGWHFYPLSATVRRNRQQITRGEVLDVGDLLEFGKTSYAVTEAFPDEDTDQLEVAPAPTVCRAFVQGLAEILVDDCFLLIGSRSDCGLRLPEDVVAPLQAILARVMNRWVLYDLTVSPDDRESTRWIAIRDGDTADLGSARITFEVLAEDEVMVPIGRPEVDTDPDISRGGPPATADTVESIAHDQADIRAAKLGVAADPVEIASRVVCGWVQLALKSGVGVTVPPLAISCAFDPDDDRLSELEAIASRLASNPRDRSQVAKLARFVRGQGYADLYRITLRRLYSLDRTDCDVALAAAEAYLDAGRDATVEINARLKLLTEADRFCAAAIEQLGLDDDTLTIRTGIEVEQTMLRNQQITRPNQRA